MKKNLYSLFCLGLPIHNFSSESDDLAKVEANRFISSQFSEEELRSVVFSTFYLYAVTPDFRLVCVLLSDFGDVGFNYV